MAVSENDLIVGPLVPAVGVDTISLDFFFERAEWLEVFKSGSDVPLIQGTDYTVTGAGTGSGVVTLTTPANGTDSYSIFLEVPLQRSSDLQLRGEFRSQPFNLELDRVWQAMQGISTRANRTIRLARTSPALPPLTFSPSADTNGRAIVFNADSSELVPGATTDEIAAAQDSAAAAQDSAAAAQDSAAAVTLLVGPDDFEGTDHEKWQALIDFLGDATATATADGQDMPVYTIDARSKRWVVDKPIIIGSVGDKTSGFFRGLTITNGVVQADPNGDWSDLEPDVPGYVFVVADHKLTDNVPQPPNPTTRLHNINFDQSFQIDCAYATGGVFWENTRSCGVESDIVDPGVGCFAIKTSEGDSTENVRGVVTNNTDLRISCRTSDGLTGRPSPLGFDGIVAEQDASTAGALVLDGFEVSGGEWVAPTGNPEILEIRSTFPFVDAGSVITIDGFADAARTTALSEAVTLRRNSTEFQQTYTTNKFAVVTGVTSDGTAQGDIGVAGSMQNGGLDLRTPDCFIPWFSAGQHNFGLVARNNGHFQAGTLHIWSKEILLDRLNFQMSANNIFADFTDIRVILGGTKVPHILGNIMTNDSTRVVLVATAAGTTGAGVSVGPFATKEGRTVPIVEVETEGSGTWGTPAYSIAPGPHNTDGGVPVMRAGPSGEFAVDRFGFVRIGEGQATGGGAVAAIHWGGDDVQIVPTNGAGGLDFAREFRFKASSGEWRVGNEFSGNTALAVMGDTLRLSKSRTITATGDPGEGGDISWDDNNLYVKTSTGWKKIALGAI